MFRGHDTPLALAYLVGLGGWVIASRLLPRVWSGEQSETIRYSWREFGISVLGGVGILIMGQLWMKGVRLPENGPTGPLTGSINQILIFAPIVLVVAARRQPWTSAWLPRGRIATRIVVGLVLSILAVATYSLFRYGADAPWALLGRIWAYDHIDEMTQVFLEDLTIAILFVRLAGVAGKLRATVTVACLFAAGHIPAMVSHGITLPDVAGLLRDTGLGVLAILVLQRSRDIVWFAFIHFCLDMTQFSGISGIG